MISKWILIIALIILVFWFAKQFRKIRKQPDTPQKVIEDMVRCAHCDVHLPKSESIAEHGHYYCCPQHQRLHSQAKSGSK